MPPKKASGPSKKSVDKEKQKVIQDKTFGLKNKNKSSKVQKYVASVKSQVQGPKKKTEEPKASKKEVEKEKQKEINQLFKPVQQKAPIGVDPKSIVCEFFKQGACTKGAKCKFSHDLEVARKAEKIDIYTDRRQNELENDTIENWDDTKLENVVNTKQTQENKNLKTEIVCRFFLEAIENKKYGWFWECPNGGEKCIYQHALPPGFVLQNKKKDPEDEEDKITIEEEIEEKRKTVVGITPVTLELFLKWKEDKRIKKEKDEAEKKKNAEIKTGRTSMSGREMFAYNPSLFIDDEDAADETAYIQEEEEIDPNVPHNVISVTETSISLTRLNKAQPHENGVEKKHKGKEEAEDDDEPCSSLPDYVDERLFITDDIPDEEDEDEEEEDEEEEA